MLSKVKQLAQRSGAGPEWKQNSSPSLTSRLQVFSTILSNPTNLSGVHLVTRNGVLSQLFVSLKERIQSCDSLYSTESQDVYYYKQVFSQTLSGLTQQREAASPYTVCVCLFVCIKLYSPSLQYILFSQLVCVILPSCSPSCRSSLKWP